MSDTVSHEPITCASCEYRYPGVKRICMMCGTVAPATEPLPPLSSVPDEFSGADYQSRPASSDSQQSPPPPGLRRLISRRRCVGRTDGGYVVFLRGSQREPA